MSVAVNRSGAGVALTFFRVGFIEGRLVSPLNLNFVFWIPERNVSKSEPNAPGFADTLFVGTLLVRALFRSWVKTERVNLRTDVIKA